MSWQIEIISGVGFVWEVLGSVLLEWEHYLLLPAMEYTALYLS